MIDVESFGRMAEHAFAGPNAHSVMSNLSNVTDADWLWTPVPGGRSIADIVEHVGGAKYAFHSAMFGDGDYEFGGADQRFTAYPGRDRAELLAWLSRGHEMVTRGLAGLIDADLARPLRGVRFRGALRDLLYLSVVHDLYHAGELSHLRSIAQGNDRWGYQGPIDDPVTH